MRLRPGTPGYRPQSRRHLGRRRRRPRLRISRSWSSGRASGLRCRGLGNLRGRREESRHPQPPQNHRASSWQQICKRETRYFQVDFLTKKNMCCSSNQNVPLFVQPLWSLLVPFSNAVYFVVSVYSRRKQGSISRWFELSFCINCSTIMS